MNARRVAPQLLRMDDVAGRLDISVDSVGRLVAAGELHAIDVRAGGTRPRLRITEDELARFIEAREIPAITDAARVTTIRTRRSTA